MSTRQLWDRVCVHVGSQLRSNVGSSTRRIAGASRAALGELTALVGTSCQTALPDAVILEDRVLFNAAPIDLAALTVETETGQLNGPADVPAGGEAQNLSDAPSSPHQPVGARTLDADHPSLLAP